MPLTMVLLGRLVVVALALISLAYFWHLVSQFLHHISMGITISQILCLVMPRALCLGCL